MAKISADKYFLRVGSPAKIDAAYKHRLGSASRLYYMIDTF